MASVREQIMEHLKTRFLAQQAGVGGYSTTWNAVVRRPFQPTEIKMGDALGVYDVEEAKTLRVGFTDCVLLVVIEFFHRMLDGDEPSTELNRMLLDIQRGMRSDINCGGLAYNITELRNELDIEGPTDRLVAGVIEFEVQYRHAVDDPSVRV